MECSPSYACYGSRDEDACKMSIITECTRSYHVFLAIVILWQYQFALASNVSDQRCLIENEIANLSIGSYHFIGILSNASMV